MGLRIFSNNPTVFLFYIPKQSSQQAQDQCPSQLLWKLLPNKRVSDSNAAKQIGLRTTVAFPCPVPLLPQNNQFTTCSITKGFPVRYLKLFFFNVPTCVNHFLNFFFFLMCKLFLVRLCFFLAFFSLQN